MLDAVLDQLEQDPAARFVLDGQTVLLEDYLQARPGQAERIAAQVRRGALEIGPWYVLADLLIPSAASLRRNLAEGRGDAAGYGSALPVLYSPDAFGHPAVLPALAKQFGIRWGVVRRGLGRPGGRDRDLYRWKGEGGASLLVYHLPAAGYDLAAGLFGRHQNLAATWHAIRRELLPRAASDQIAVPLGADHHPMCSDVAGLCAGIQALEPDHVVRVSGFTEYFEAVERSRPKLDTIRGELRRGDGHSWLLQGVHAARSRMKRSHGRAELYLSRIAEPLAGLARRRGGADQSAALRLAWRTLLQCQFHDTLAGTTSDPVQLEQEVRLAAVAALSREIVVRSVAVLAGYDPDRAREQPAATRPSLVLWNPARRSRTGIVTAELTFFRSDVAVGAPSGRPVRKGPGYRPFALRTSGGVSLPVQLLSVQRGQERLDAPAHYPDQDAVDRVWVAFRSPGVPGHGIQLLSPEPARATPPAEQLTVGNGRLANRFVAVRVTRTGGLTLTDLRTGTTYPDLCELSDEPDHGDLYTFSRGRGREARGGRPRWQRVIARGPLLGAIETRWRQASAGAGRLEARLVVALHADSPIVRLRLDLDNQAVDHRLRARFPIGAAGAATAGAPLGLERREPESPKRSALEQEVSTAPAQRWVAAGSGARSLAVLAPGFFEYEWTAEGVLSVTLLRSVGELSRTNLPERPGHAAWPTATPGAQEPGLHTIELGVATVPGTQASRPKLLDRLWEDAFLTLQTSFLRDYLNPAAP